jgi:hypothetical protein
MSSAVSTVAAVNAAAGETRMPFDPLAEEDDGGKKMPAITTTVAKIPGLSSPSSSPTKPPPEGIGNYIAVRIGRCVAAPTTAAMGGNAQQFLQGVETDMAMMPPPLVTATAATATNPSYGTVTQDGVPQEDIPDERKGDSLSDSSESPNNPGSTMYEDKPLPTQYMLDQEWGIHRILGILDIGKRVELICKQCRDVGFNYGKKTTKSANYLRAVHEVGELPQDTVDRLNASGFLFTEQGEIKCCSSYLSLSSTDTDSTHFLRLS